jgi:chorismate dehydratase
LNTRPLIFRLQELAPHIDLVLDLPSRLADDLAATRLDVALIPSIELLGREDYMIVSDACIACRGPVLSVKLLARDSMQQVRTLALDEGSRTSGVLAQILLRERYGLSPEIASLPVGADIASFPADAVLVIGDRAIHPAATAFREQWDLGEEWVDWSGLPFVFAVWAGRSSDDQDRLATALAAARDEGLRNLDQIAARHASRVGMTREQALRYLRDNLHFTLGPEEQRGLELFYKHAAAMGAAGGSSVLTAHVC